MNSEEPPREELLARLEVLTNELTKAFVNNVERALRTCVTCEHFDEASAKCGLNHMQPPPRIIAFGCECYEQQIPF